MTGLSNELYQRCRTTLLKCSEFDSNELLRAVFVTAELSPFRSGLPDAANKAERVDVCLDFLLPKRLSDGRPVLPLFLAALRDRYQPGDALRDELEALSDAVQFAMVQPEPESPSPPKPPTWEPPDALQPTPSPEPPTEKPPVKIPLWTWVLLALLVLDFCLVILWGWCLFGDQPNLIAYLGIVFAFVALPLAILTSIFVTHRSIVLEDVLRRLGTSQRCRCVILALSGLIVIITFLFWPLGWVGKCGPISTPTPTHIPSPTPTAAIVHLADARVSFTITLSGDGKREVPAGGTLTLAPGDKVLIELSVTVGTSPFPRDLTYRYFAPGGSIPEELTGPSASYVVPEQPGSDAITVQITDPATGDSILRSINVVVSEGS